MLEQQCFFLFHFGKEYYIELKDHFEKPSVENSQVNS